MINTAPSWDHDDYYHQISDFAKKEPKVRSCDVFDLAPQHWLTFGVNYPISKSSHFTEEPEATNWSGIPQLKAKSSYKKERILVGFKKL